MKKNIAVIGSGYWGKNLIRNFYELGSLKYIYDENKSSEKLIRDEYKIKQISFDEILHDKEIEGVVIATPAETHHSIAKLCIKAKKHVFVEKPICLNIEDAIDLKEISEKNGVQIMVGHLLNYNDHFNKLVELVGNNNYGDLIKIKSSRKSFGKLRDSENVIWSFAPHDISMVNRLTKGEVENLRVSKNSYFTDNCDSAYISYQKSGVIIEIDVDWTSVEKLHRFEVFFSDVILIFEDSVQDPDKKLCIINTKFNKEVLKNKSMFNKKYIKTTFNQPLKNECSHFLSCVENNTKPLTDVDESISVLQTLLDTDEN